MKPAGDEKQSTLPGLEVILQVAYMSAFRPSFSLSGSFARVFKIFTHAHSTPAQARGKHIAGTTHECSVM